MGVSLSSKQGPDFVFYGVDVCKAIRKERVQ